MGEAGTRAVVGVVAGGYAAGELTLVRPLLPCLCAGMLCLCDRSFDGLDLWEEARRTRADLLWRIQKNLVFPAEKILADGSYLSRAFPSDRRLREGHPRVPVRLIDYHLEDHRRPHAEPRHRLVTTILEPDQAPADELAAQYAQRWEVEISIKEIKVHQGRPNVVLRSRKPDGVLQEPYGFPTEAVAEVRGERNPWRPRSNPRVLKRAVFGYPPRREEHHNWPNPPGDLPMPWRSGRETALALAANGEITPP